MSKRETKRYFARLRAVFRDDARPYGWLKDDKEFQLRLLEWAEVHGVRYSRNGRCLHWISKGQCAVSICEENNYDWMDHVSGWTHNGKPAILVCQPYHINDEQVDEIDRVARKFKLNAWISDKGSWYGNGTVYIALRPLAPPWEVAGARRMAK